MTPRVEATSQRAALRTLLGDYPTTRAVRRGELTAASVRLEFADIAVPNKAFKRVVRDLEFDVAELALMTFLIARSRDVPIRLLPVTVFARNPLPYLVHDRSRRRLAPRDLHGRCIGVRSYTTTTAVWIRGILSDAYGVDLDSLKWVAFEEGHVPGVPDPPNVRRDKSGTDLLTLLCDGAVDAVIVDPVPAGTRFAPVVPDPDAVLAAWQRRHDAITINHIVTVRESLATDARVIAELLAVFRESRDRGGVSPAAAPLGLAANRRNLDVAIAVAEAQGLLARPLSVDELATGGLAALE